MALPRVFGVLIFDDFTSLDVMGPLAYLNNLPDVEIYLIHDSKASVPTGGRWPSPAYYAGQRYLADWTLDNPPALDVLIVPGGFGTRRLVDDRRWEDFVTRIYPSLRYLLTVCTGTSIVARTGLLDRRRATSNKAAFRWVQTQGPNVDWVAEARWIVDGNVWTSSGVEAGTDMTHAFIESTYGRDMAFSIANKLEFIPTVDSSYDPFASIYGLTPPRATTKEPLPSPPPPSPAQSVSCHWGILVYPGMVMLDVVSVASFPETIGMRTEFPSKVSVIAPSFDSVQSFSQSSLGGQRIVPTHTLSNPPTGIDVLVIPGSTTAQPFQYQVEYVAFIRNIFPTVKHIISVGTGSALLAAAGILDGRKATTSKSLFEHVTSQSEDRNISWTVGRWVRDGNVWTASGTAAGLDAAYALCSEMFGEAVAHDAAVLMEYEPHKNSSEDPFAEVWGVSPHRV